MKRLVLATTNFHKIREYKALFKGRSGIDLITLAEFPAYVPPEETGSTFEENGKIKALHAAKALQEWVLADDSGLVVPALGGAPGVYSARFAGQGATDLENRKKLLEAMRLFADEQRDAYYECALVLASPDGALKVSRGIVEGRIGEEEKGNLGFGYDPLFTKHEYSKTFGEIAEAVKNRISHRRKALDRLAL